MAKFVDWIPTQPEFINAFFEFCPLTSSDVVYDLGSGDGRLLFAAIEKGAGRCVGIDIDHQHIKSSSDAAKINGLYEKVQFIESDVMEVDLSEASVVLCYLYSSASAALRPKFEKELKAGTKIVMESFPIPGWKPARESVVNGKTFYFYMMPFEKAENYERAIDAPVYNYYQCQIYPPYHG